MATHLCRGAVACALLVVCAAALACQTPYERAYGVSYADHTAAMIANPAAGAADLEAPRPDGSSTDAALYKFREREAEADEGEPPPVINVDVGGGS
jgi:hypothetical protein